MLDFLLFSAREREACNSSSANSRSWTLKDYYKRHRAVMRDHPLLVRAEAKSIAPERGIKRLPRSPILPSFFRLLQRPPLRVVALWEMIDNERLRRCQPVERFPLPAPSAFTSIALPGSPAAIDQMPFVSDPYGIPFVVAPHLGSGHPMEISAASSASSHPSGLSSGAETETLMGRRASMGCWRLHPLPECKVH